MTRHPSTSTDAGDVLNLARFPRYRLAFLPTPLHPLKRLSAYLGGPEIWVKRDDCTGLAGGGNKTRKLEFFIADALAKGADTIVTVGGIQSNHTRQTAAAAAAAGLRCELLQMNWVPSDDERYDTVGNILFSRLLAAQLNLPERRCTVGESEPEFDEILERLRGEGRRPYAIPGGGSDHPLGGLGYVLCAHELTVQAKQLDISFDTVVHATSSGSTQAGLVAGFHALGAPVRVIGIDVNDDPAFLREVVPSLTAQTLAQIGRTPDRYPADRIAIRADYMGPGYGLPGPGTCAAIRTMASLEGILLDPVYEGKAVEGLIDLVRRGDIVSGERVLYLHLGGAPALHAYASLFAETPAEEGAP